MKNLKLIPDDLVTIEIQKRNNDISWFCDLVFSNKNIQVCLKPNNFVFDVGAFIGSTTTYFLNKDCIVFSFEPNITAYDCLIYNCPEAFTFNHALGKKNQKVSKGIIDGQKGGRKNLGGQGYYENINGENVMCLDDFLLVGKCDFIKIDVEGFEPNVILGGLEFLQKYKPTLFIENHRTQLKRHGFNVNDIINPLLKIDYSNIIDLKHDLLFIHKEKGVM